MNLDSLDDAAKKYAGWPERLSIIVVDRGTAYAGDINLLQFDPNSLIQAVTLKLLN
jgi:hypothetical protein